MFWPVVSATATMIGAFLPMLLWPGIPGKFMSYFPITLIIILSSSMIVALIFLPVLGGMFGKAPPHDEAARKGDRSVGDRRLARYSGYHRLVCASVRKADHSIRST